MIILEVALIVSAVLNAGLMLYACRIEERLKNLRSNCWVQHHSQKRLFELHPPLVRHSLADEKTKESAEGYYDPR